MFELPQYECKRCNHKWIPRKNNKPIECPFCKSRRWDQNLDLEDDISSLHDIDKIIEDFQ
jgi:Zn finger protein HypA/HybF involved in hydrogenase expression